MRQERRKHVRFPVMRDMAKPIEIKMDDQKETTTAFIIDLSAGGIGLLTLRRLKPKTLVSLSIDLPGIKIGSIKSEVRWVKSHSGTYRMGLKFLSLSKKWIKRINEIAEDYNLCEERIAADLPWVCTKDCRYYMLCEKGQKR